MPGIPDGICGVVWVMVQLHVTTLLFMSRGPPSTGVWGNRSLETHAQETQNPR